MNLVEAAMGKMAARAVKLGHFDEAVACTLVASDFGIHPAGSGIEAGGSGG